MKKKNKIITFIACLSVLGMAPVLSSCGNNNGKATSAAAAEENSAVKYSVTLDPNGGHFSNGRTEPLTVSVNENGKINFTKFNVEMDNNELIGWYYEDLVTPFPMARKVTSDLSLVAKWSTSEEAVTYDLAITIEEKALQLTYEDGVYQFSYTGTIYGGYTSRPAMYTIYEDALVEGMESDDGTTQKVIYRAETNYVESTGGEVYALFYNDASFELFYKYMYQGVWNDYSMIYGTFDYKGYEAPFARPADVSAYVQGTGLHSGWENPFAKSDDDEATETITPVNGASIYQSDCTTDDLMKLEFYDNGTYETLYNYGGAGTYYATGQKGTWSEEEGKVVLSDATLEEESTDTCSVYTISGNKYNVESAAVIAAKPADNSIIYTAESIDSESMRATFRKDHTYDIEYNMNGEWVYTQMSGTYNIVDGALSIDTGLTEAENPKEGAVYFKRSGAVYEVVTADLASALQ